MAASLLFSEDMLYSFTDIPTTQRQPPQLQVATSRTTAVEQWLSQQIHSTTFQPAYNMSSFDGQYMQHNHISDEVTQDGYTFTTEHHQDEYTHWPNVQQAANSTLHSEQQIAAPLPSPSHAWNNFPYSTTTGDHVSSPVGYLLSPNYSPQTTLSPFSITMPALPHTSPATSALSLSPAFSGSPGLPSPSTPESVHQSFMPSPSPSETSMMMLMDNNQTHSRPDRPLYTHREQLVLFRDALSLPLDNAGPFVPQQMYKPHTTSDLRRYVEEVQLEEPLYFIAERSQQYGIRLEDALHLRTRKLRNNDQVVFEGRGPSVSIRLEWPGYRQWSRQIPTKDFRSPPQLITLAKLAKNVAKCVQRFLNERKGQPMEEDVDPRWRIGDGRHDIKLEDLVLVSLHHVSLGSWQPQLRLVRPLPQRRDAMPLTPLRATDMVGPLSQQCVAISPTPLSASDAVGPLPQRRLAMPPTPLTATNAVPPMSFGPLPL